MALWNDLKRCKFTASLTRNPVKTLAKDIVRAQEEIKVEDTMDSNDMPKKGTKDGDFRAGCAPKALAPYGKMTDTSQREKAHIEPKQNQREVCLAIQASLPKAKLMKESSIVVCKSSGWYCEYHQDYGHTIVECWVMAKIIKDLE